MASEPAQVAPNLYRKLSTVMQALSAIPKTGTSAAQQGSYRFIESAMLMAILRPLFADNGIVLIPEVLGHSVRNPEGSRQTYITCEMRVTLVNADNPEDRIAMAWMAEAGDTGDKAINKAVTAGVKYLLLKLLMISDRDEPDADADDTTPPPMRQQRPPQQTPPPRGNSPATSQRPPLLDADAKDRALTAVYGELWTLQARVNALTGKTPEVPDSMTLPAAIDIRDKWKARISEMEAERAAQPVGAK